MQQIARNPLLEQDEENPFAPEVQQDPDALDLAGIPNGPDQPVGPDLVDAQVPRYSGVNNDQGYPIDESPPATPRPSGLTRASAGPTAADNLRAILARAKEVNTPKSPGILNRIGAAGLGFAAGFNNANPRRTQVNPSAAIQNILYPGQAERERSYQAELAAAQEADKMETSSKLEDARVAELEARAKAEEERGAAYAASRKIPVKPQTPLEKYNALMTIPGVSPEIASSIAATGKPPATAPRKSIADIEAGLLDKIQNAPPGSDEEARARDLLELVRSGREKPVKEPNAPAMTQVSPEVGKKIGVMPDAQGRYMVPNTAIGAQIRETERPATTEKPPTRNQFAGVESKKQTALASSQHQLQKDLNPTSGMDPQQAWENHRERAQNTQNAYEQELATMTGQHPGHYEYPPVEEMMNQGSQPSGPGRGGTPAAQSPVTPTQQPTAIPPRPPQIPVGAQAQYNPATKQWRFRSSEKGPWQVLQ